VPGEYLETKDDSLRQLSDNAVTKIYRGISEKASLNTKSGTWNKIRSHNMRKYFFSALVNAGCPHDTAHYMMGHKVGAVNAAYTRYNVEDLKQLYLKYMPYLTIARDLDVSESAEYQRIKEENEVLKAEAIKSGEYKDELARSKAYADVLRAAYDVMAKAAMGEAEFNKQREEADREFKKENEGLLRRLGMWKD
jgi:hypothetical protein